MERLQNVWNGGFKIEGIRMKIYSISKSGEIFWKFGLKKLGSSIISFYKWKPNNK